jgi:hypothetical protein
MTDSPLKDLSSALHRLKECDKVYLSWSDLSDFTTVRPSTIIFYTRSSTIEIPVPHEDIKEFFGMLEYMFAPERVILAWNIKEFFSYFRFHSQSRFSIHSPIIDLKLCEAFTGRPGYAPKSYEEAAKRAAIVLKDDAVLKMNNWIYTPLATEVIPAIETHGLSNKETGQVEYSSYQIEGSINGRMTTIAPFDRCFTPHNMESAKKQKFSCGYEKKFVVLDYKHMEASVLSWLSKDPTLGEIINSGEDTYTAIYRIITGSRASNANRKWIKDIFLPIVYGQQANSLAARADVSVNGAQSLIDTIQNRFPVAMGWIEEKYQEVVKNGTIRDAFGRILNFENRDSAWSARNAIVQAPSSTICIEKLIKLYRYDSLEIVASVHDAYVCAIDNIRAEAVMENAKDILESPSDFAPDVKLKVGIEVGDWE